MRFVRSFRSTREAQARGFDPSHFSFNLPGGRCEVCQGDGTVTVEMQFLADVELVCEECKGTRFKQQILDIRYRGKNVHEVLNMTVREAITFFREVPKITNRLRVLDDVGLGYLRLGQSATTLSGGEAQRIKLAAHLLKRTGAKTLYIFDEPTTGLHFDDINKLLAAFRALIDAGGSLLVIEHNLDVIKTADHIIDLGAEGGDAGGYVVGVGTPEEIMSIPESYTGRFLRRLPREIERSQIAGVGTMSLSKQIVTDLTAAMKAQDAARTSTLRMVKAAMMNRQIEKGAELDDDDMQKLLRSTGEAKTRLDRTV